MTNLPLFFLFTFLAGIIGGAGMGGGTLLIPCLTLFLGIGQIQAQWLNLITFVPMSIVALCLHIKNGLVEFKKIILPLVFGIATALPLSFLVGRIGEAYLRKAFGVFLVALGILGLYKMLSRYRLKC